MLSVDVVLVHVLEAVTGRTGHDLTLADLNKIAEVHPFLWYHS